MFYVSIESHLNLSAQLSHELFVNLSSKIDFVSREWSFHELFNIRYINNFLIHPMCILKKRYISFLCSDERYFDSKTKKKKKKKNDKLQQRNIIFKSHLGLNLLIKIRCVSPRSGRQILINGNSSSGLRIDFWILRGL